MRLSRAALAAAPMAALFALGAFLPIARSGNGDVPVLRVEAQEFVRRIPAQGNLQAVRATPITAPVGVRGPFRIGWLAPDGSLVKAGEVVIRFDPSAAEQRLIDAEDELREARLKLEKEQVEGSAEVRKLDHDVAIARVELE